MHGWDVDLLSDKGVDKRDAKHGNDGQSTKYNLEARHVVEDRRDEQHRAYRQAADDHGELVEQAQ